MQSIIVPPITIKKDITSYKISRWDGSTQVASMTFDEAELRNYIFPVLAEYFPNYVKIPKNHQQPETVALIRANSIKSLRESQDD